MPALTAHPSREQLSAYNLGQLPPDEAVAVESHISECEPCCDTIISLSSDDTFVGLLKEARELPTDQTADYGVATMSPSCQDVPVQLAEHPRYEVLGLIGKGGMGDVYKARHRKMERTVALKVINRGLVRKAEAVDRFHREVKAAAQLTHPNIVTAYDADHAGDFHFMVMEFVDGVDLSQTVKDRGALPVAEACDYIRQAAIGLQHAHECGTVHRDIKPHNLMVTTAGTVKILDFGLASLAPEAISASNAVAARSDLTAAGAIMGTPDFISPEQASDARQADIRSDIYSLGATLYYLLSGQVPFAEGSVMHKLKSHAQVEPVSLDSLRDDLPGELVAIVSKMTAKAPDERYLTPKEVADALESFLRTWQPGEANSQGQLVLGGGNNFESGEQNSGAGDAGRDWLLVIARVLFAISLVPVALLCYETWAFDRANPDLGAGYRVWAYMLVTVCLSTIAGFASAVHRLNTGRSPSNRGDRRVFRMTAIEALAVAAVLIAGCLAAGLYYTTGNIGGIRVDVTAPEDIGSLGAHPLTIVDTSGKKPRGGTTITHQDDAAGITTHSFESANGRYKITLVNEVLTVNGEQYALENPNDAIRIVDDRVEITRVVELPKELERLQGDWEAVSVTDSGKQLSNEDGFGRVLLQLKDNTFVIMQRKPDGAKNDVDAGQIEINSSATPKTIDFIGRAERRFGIYEFKQGMLRVCLVEQAGPEGPRGERFPDGNPVKRPTTFESPTRSNMILMEFQREKPDENVTRQSVEPSFSYDLSQVPDDIREIYGYRPRQFREDGRFQRILETLDQAGPNNFLIDGNLEQVLILKWANADRSYVQPLIVLTVIDGAAREFALKHFGVPIDDAAQRTYYPIEPGKFFPMPEAQFVRFVDDKTLILSSQEFLAAHQIALKKSPNTTFQEVAATMPDAPLWVIANTSAKTFLDGIEFVFGESPLATMLMAQLPLWEDTSHLTLTLLLGSEPNLQLSAHALAADKQTAITQTLRTLPVTLANLLRATNKSEGLVDQAAMSSLVTALSNAQVTEPSATISRATISLKDAEPHLLKLLNSFLDVEQARTSAYKAASVSNLRQIGLAFELFEQEYGYLPSDTTMLPGAQHPVSWRVAILKYLDEGLFVQYKLDEPWDSEHNKKLLESLPSFYQHFSQDSEMPYTCYVTLVGKDAATGNDKTPPPNRDGAKTILVIESITDIPWTKPEDVVVTEEEPFPIYRPQPDGWNALYGDGKVRFIPFENR